MPTVSNRDLNGHWNEHQSMGVESLASKRLKEGHELSVSPNANTIVANNIAEEHRYAVNQRFISSNSYYGYHPVISSGNSEDCSMDTSEAGAIGGFVPDKTFGTAEWLVSRKRCFDDSVEADDVAVGKRGRYDSFQESRPSCNPPPQPFPVFPGQQELPGSTSYLMESLMPRPRCLMGHYV